MSIIYEISWRPDNTEVRAANAQNYESVNAQSCLELASASADGTVRIWSIPRFTVNLNHFMDANKSCENFEMPEENVSGSDEDTSIRGDKDRVSGRRKKKKRSKRNKSNKKSAALANTSARLDHTLLHNPPTYVYTTQYHPTATDPTVIVTGSFDHFVRLWTNEGELLGKLDRGRAHHRSYINAATFSNDGNRLFTGDGNGIINVWRLETGRRPSNPNAWHLARMIDDQDLRGNPINSIKVHPKEKLLLVSAHQHLFRLFELRRYNRVHNGYIGAPVSQSNINCIFSPDGKYVLSGGEDGKPHFWNTMTTFGTRGKRWQLGYGKPLCGVAWHPTQHLVAFSSFGGKYPILMYEAFRQVGDEDR